MRVPARAAVGALLVAAAACGDATREPSVAPTAPSLVVTGGPCSNTLRQQASDYIDQLYPSGSQRNAAKQLLTQVAQACSTTDPSAARPAMFGLIRYNISTLALGTKTNPNDPQLVALANLWNTLVVYIGFTSTNISPAALTTAGAVRVVSDPATFDSVPRAPGVNASGDYVDIVTVDGQALLRVPKGATTTGLQTLYTVAPIACGALGSNLPVRAGRCYDATDTPNFGTFAQPLTVAICQTQDPNAPAPINANAISHRNEGATVPAVLPLKFVLSAGFCPHPPGPFDPSSNVFARVWRGVTHFASALFTPKTLWAPHGNLGGSTPAISPFGAVDRDIFRATFTANPLGALPSPTAPMLGDDVGSWSDVFAQSPGSINVAAALDEATNKPVVLNQAGGNCANTCGGLRLEGQVITSFQGEAIDEDIGKYVVTWDLLQDKPSVKEAPFMLLTGTRDTIVKVAYVTLPSGRFINVNGTAFTQGSTRLGWVPGRLQRFRFQIDLTTSPASCTLSVTPLTGPTPAAVTGSCSRGASLVGQRLRFVRADFTGIDAGVFAWDDIRVSLFSTTPLAPQ